MEDVVNMRYKSGESDPCMAISGLCHLGSFRIRSRSTREQFVQIKLGSEVVSTCKKTDKGKLVVYDITGYPTGTEPRHVLIHRHISHHTTWQD